MEESETSILATLAKDTRTWIENHRESSSYFEGETNMTSLPLAKPVAQQAKPPITNVSSLEKSSIEKPKNLSPKIEEKPKDILKPSPIETKPPAEISRLDEMKQLFKKHNQQQFREELPTFIKLVTTNKEALTFLQKLELAISDAFLPAKAICVQDDKEIRFALNSTKLLLASLSEMQCILCDFKVENVNIHEIVKIETFYWIPLHPCHQYLKDPGLKRALWNCLKSLNFADLLA